jgi:hydroxymethylpyrimidine/phosphomethylpyrimidine kinase
MEKRNSSAKKVLLSIGGYDPTSGAGTGLDVNVFQSLGFHGMGIVTALTAQNTQGVDSLYCPPADWLKTQFRSLSKDVVFAGIKVGMVGQRANIPIIIEILSRHSSLPRVIDPVFQSSSGAWLLEKDAVPDYLSTVSGHMNLLTPNTHEASLITGLPVTTLDDMTLAAKKIFSLFRIPSLIKGGHLEKEAADVLFDGRDFHIFKHERLDIEVHGTGCLLASSLVAFLSQGKELKKACRMAVDYTVQSLRNSIPVGRGQRLFSFSRD